jgi:hypothetical protein
MSLSLHYCTDRRNAPGNPFLDRQARVAMLFLSVDLRTCSQAGSSSAGRNQLLQRFRQLCTTPSLSSRAVWVPNIRFRPENS